MEHKQGCDYCSDTTSLIQLYCPTCGGELCSTCYNRTCGGRVQFTTKKKSLHLAMHSRMRVKTSKEEVNFPTTNVFFLGAKSYLTFKYVHTVTTLVHIEQNKESLTSWLVEITPSSEVGIASVVGTSIKMRVLSHIHSMEAEATLDKEDIKELIHESKERLVCKGVEFGLLLRECLDSLNYPSCQVNAIIADLEPCARSFKIVAFRLISSACEVTSSCDAIHLPGICVIWCGNPSSIQNTDPEHEQLTKVTNITRGLRSNSFPIREGHNYTIMFTHQQVSGSII